MFHIGFHAKASWGRKNQKKPDHSDLSDPTPKELPTGQRYPQKSLHVRSLDGTMQRAMMRHTPKEER